MMKITVIRMVLIGLMGNKGSGKSTAANFFVTNAGFVEKSFAEPLKKACQELFLLTDSQVFGTQEEKETPDERWFGCTPRKILQFVGTDLLRDNLDRIMPGLGHDVFTHHFKLWYESVSSNPYFSVVVSDVRFQNEIDLIHELGGLVFKITRPGLDTTTDLHPSEIEMQKITSYDFLIENDGTIEEFYHKIGTTKISQAVVKNFLPESIYDKLYGAK